MSSATKSKGTNGSAKRAARPPARGNPLERMFKERGDRIAGVPELQLIRWFDKTPAYKNSRRPQFQVHADLEPWVQHPEGWLDRVEEMTGWTGKEVQLARAALESGFRISVPCASADDAVSAIPFIFSMLRKSYMARFCPERQCIVFWNRRISEQRSYVLDDPYEDPSDPIKQEDDDDED